MVNLEVNLSPREASEKVEHYVTNTSISTNLINKYIAENQTNEQLFVLVFEKYYMRNNSRTTLTVVIENINGITKVEAVGSGGSTGVFLNFDWGASDDFCNLVYEALKNYAN